MSESRPKAQLVRIRYREGKTGLIYATSPDMKGLVIGRATLEELMKAIPEAIKDMYLACGVQVMVTMIESDDQAEEESWVAVPAEIARAALAEKVAV